MLDGGERDSPECTAETLYTRRPAPWAERGSSSLHPAAPPATRRPKPLCSPRTTQTGRPEAARAAAHGATWHLAHTHLKHRGSVPLEATPAQDLSDPLVPGQRSGAQAAGAAELGVPNRSACGSFPTYAGPGRGQRGRDHTIPSMEMGSRMPNCLSTAMNSSTTTAMAHSSMPWMPMAARALPPRRRAGVARGSGGNCGSHAPSRRGCGCLRGRGPAQGGGGELGPARRCDAARRPIRGATF